MYTKLQWVKAARGRMQPAGFNAILLGPFRAGASGSFRAEAVKPVVPAAALRLHCPRTGVAVSCFPSAGRSSEFLLKIRFASTLILLRDAPHGPELLMQRRAPGAAFLGGAYVFPGGALEPSDSDPRIRARTVGLTDEEASDRLGLPAGGLAYWIAAARESFEEAGVLLALDEAGMPVPPERIAELAVDREALNRGKLTFAEMLARHSLLLPAREFLYVDRWITPPDRARRFDARFFLARAPRGQDGSHDNNEAVHSIWLRPAEALARSERKEIEIAFATGVVLKELAGFATVDEAMAHARAKGPIETNWPAVAQGSAGPKIFRRGDAALAEIRWCDPEETTQTTYDLAPGVPKRLDRFVTRIIAPNPGMMTGPGTNTYIVGDGGLAVIDPGPAIESHVAAIVALGDGRIRWILCTHTHRDHSPAAQALQAATGASIIGLPPPDESHDQGFVPDLLPSHCDPLRIGGVTLRALHTPGHASNHLCFLLEDTKMLFAGDHVMQGTTVIINPPDGDMRAYIDSLDALLSRDIAIIAPGHGYLIGSPHREIRRIIQHRLMREQRVVDAVERHGSATLDELLPDVYADTPPRLHAAAARSLLAHLNKLVAEGRAHESEGRYRPGSSS
jgi:glyoxylase-like metal-dependent hydrolase (beta-lactamase superfamily II)/8-oxo-dGTP pyrophosphatase MutT (NUDIX family)